MLAHHQAALHTALTSLHGLHKCVGCVAAFSMARLTSVLCKKDQYAICSSAGSARSDVSQTSLEVCCVVDASVLHADLRRRSLGHLAASTCRCCGMGCWQAWLVSWLRSRMPMRGPLLRCACAVHARIQQGQLPWQARRLDLVGQRRWCCGEDILHLGSSVKCDCCHATWQVCDTAEAECEAILEAGHSRVLPSTTRFAARFQACRKRFEALCIGPGAARQARNPLSLLHADPRGHVQHQGQFVEQVA